MIDKLLGHEVDLTLRFIRGSSHK